MERLTDAASRPPHNTPKVQRQCHATHRIETPCTAGPSNAGNGCANGCFPRCFHLERNAGHRSAKQSKAPQRKANRAGHWQQWLSRCVFTSTAEQSRAMHCKATHGKAKQIGLAVGNSSPPDVFSHQPQWIEPQRRAKHSNAAQSTPAWALETVPSPGRFDPLGMGAPSV